MQLPGPGVFGPPKDHDQAIAVLRRAVELGVDHIDTSQYYGPDVANDLIREALHPYPDDLALVSKVGAGRDDAGGWTPAQRPAQLREGVEANLRCARHRAARRGQPAPHGRRRASRPASAPCRWRTSSSRWSRCATRARSPASASPPRPLDEVESAIATAGIVCVQNPFSLLDRHDETCSTAAPGPASPTCRTSRSAPPSRGLPKVVDDPVVQRIAARARRHPGPGRPGLAARARRQRPAHPGHVVSLGPPRGEPRASPTSSCRPPTSPTSTPSRRADRTRQRTAQPTDAGSAAARSPVAWMRPRPCWQCGPPQCSTILPSRIRRMAVPLISTGSPEGGTSKNARARVRADDGPVRHDQVVGLDQQVDAEHHVGERGRARACHQSCSSPRMSVPTRRGSPARSRGCGTRVPRSRTRRRCRRANIASQYSASIFRFSDMPRRYRSALGRAGAGTARSAVRASLPTDRGRRRAERGRGSDRDGVGIDVVLDVVGDGVDDQQAAPAIRGVLLRR